MARFKTGLLLDVLAGLFDRSLGGGCHIDDGQAFRDDQAMLADKLGRPLVQHVLAPVSDLAVPPRERPPCFCRTLRPLAAQRLGKLSLGFLERVRLLVQRPVIGELNDLAQIIGHCGEGFDAPIQTAFPLARPLPMRLAFHHKRQEPSIDLALNVTADDAARRPGFAPGLDGADAGQAQTAMLPVVARNELEAVAMRLEAEAGKAMPGLEAGKPGSSSPSLT
jgi:hypothetical protein